MLTLTISSRWKNTSFAQLVAKALQDVCLVTYELNDVTWDLFLPKGVASDGPPKSRAVIILAISGTTSTPRVQHDIKRRLAQLRKDPSQSVYLFVDEENKKSLFELQIFATLTLGAKVLTLHGLDEVSRFKSAAAFIEVLMSSRSAKGRNDFLIRRKNDPSEEQLLKEALRFY